jgi:signal transduction histidine kinase
MRAFIKRLYFSPLRKFHQQVGGDRSELKRILITLQFVHVTILGLLVFAFMDAWFGLPFNFTLDLVALAFFLGALYLIHRHYLKKSKYVIFVTTNAVLFLTASSQGLNAGSGFIFFPIITGIFTLFSYREWRAILFCVSITTGTFLLLELTDYSYLNSSDLPPAYQYLSYLTNFFISILMVGYFTYSHARANARTENKLKRLNLRLHSQNRQLKKTNTELDSFVYKASHDLRSPLTSLLGLIAISRLESDLEKLKAYGELQEKLIRKLDTYIQDILAISRNSNQDLRREVIRFDQLMEQSLEQLHYLEQYARIEKIIHLPETGTSFYSDAPRISIVLNNLLANAMRYADLAKERPYFQLDIRITSQQAVIELTDNGIGIEDKHLKHIFQMFYRATDKTPGSGLGLYIVGEVVEKLGGSIEVTSQEGKGTRFLICLPNVLLKEIPQRLSSDQLALIA